MRRGSVGSVGLVVLCILAAFALRVPYLTWPLMQDEAGLLIIAEQWREGPFLYGDYFVSRGTLMLLVYALADALGAELALRLLGAVVSAILVGAAGWAGHLLRGRRGAGWSALVATGYSSTYLLSSQVMNERLMAAALVTVSCAAVLAAVTGPSSPRRRQALAVLAGAAATSALLVVQSFGGGVVFGAVLLVAARRSLGSREVPAGRLALAAAFGTLLPLAVLSLATLAWWPTVQQVWFQMFGYRLDAVGALAGMSLPRERMLLLVIVATLTGMVPMLVSHLAGYRGLGDAGAVRPVWLAVVAMLPVAGVGMLLGGSWYPDYLLELVPPLVVAAGLVAPLPTWSGIGMRVGAVMAAAAAVVAAMMGIQRPIFGTTTNEAAIGEWVETGTQRDDTGIVFWGNANILYAAGLTSPYPYLWGLLTRTLDSDLELLLSTMRGPDAPTWIVEWHDLETLDLDGADELIALVDRRYSHVGAACGADVYVLQTERRTLPPLASCGLP